MNIEENTYYKALINLLTEIFALDSSGHDITHLKRVANSAMKIQNVEGGNADVVLAAALLHDVHRVIQNQTGIFCEPKDSLVKISVLLEKVNFPKELQQNVLNAIEHHEEYSFSDGKKTTAIEDRIIQDADNLDAFGAIGIARAFTFGGAKNVPIYDESRPLTQTHFKESILDPSEIHHIYNKHLRLAANMNTKTARSMAANREKFTNLFLEQFLAEWNNKG